MMQLHQDFDKFNKKSVKIVVICPEKSDKVEAFKTKYGLSFELVADFDHQIADRYEQKVKILKFGRLPAQIVLGKDKRTVFKHYSKNMKDIVSNFEILSSL